jgi:hypothetical protein
MSHNIPFIKNQPKVIVPKKTERAGYRVVVNLENRVIGVIIRESWCNMMF